MAAPDPAALARYASALVAAARPCDAAMDRLEPRGPRARPNRLHAAAEAARDRCYEAAQELLKVDLPASADGALNRKLTDARTLLFLAYRSRMNAAAAAMAYLDDPRPSHLSAARKAVEEAGENLALARAALNQTFAQQGAKVPF